MNIVETKIKGVFLIEPVVFGDHRGFFTETFKSNVFEKWGLPSKFIQDNHSMSLEAGTLRGLHYQKNPKAQTKLVRAIRGAIFDVAVDIRKGSPTYGQSVDVLLTAENKRQLLVPRGFAHGFVTLSPQTEVVYKVDEYYSPEDDRNILWNDPAIGIHWPFSSPILNDKDKQAPLLKDADNNFSMGEI